MTFSLLIVAFHNFQHQLCAQPETGDESKPLMFRAETTNHTDHFITGLGAKAIQSIV